MADSTNSNTNPSGWRLDHSYAQLPAMLFTRQEPAPVQSPKLVVLNEQLAAELGLSATVLRSAEGAEIFAGNRFPVGADPLAQAYAGHQFGHFNILGDGRALLLGEQLTPASARLDIQLKGSGPTPYSRRGDGRAALGPMLREYIISEAMHALGIPTTRSLAVAETGESIQRETALPGAVLTRVAASHIRVGTFQYAAARGSHDELKMLADYTIRRHYPELDAGEGRYLAFFNAVARKQAALIARWQLVGFVHGVMNTDNMAISGETIDYGPCAFLDTYDPDTVFSSIDTHGRYAYGHQPHIGGWNLARFAETLLPLIDSDQERAIELAQSGLAAYQGHYQACWLEGMRAKLGLFGAEDADEELAQRLLNVMHKYRVDYTNTFCALTTGEGGPEDLFASEEFAKWRSAWEHRLARQTESRAASQQLMRASNPAVIPRNHLVEEALEAAVREQDLSVMQRLLDVLAEPYAHDAGYSDLYTKPACTSRPYRTFCGT